MLKYIIYIRPNRSTLISLQINLFNKIKSFNQIQLNSSPKNFKKLIFSTFQYNFKKIC